MKAKQGECYEILQVFEEKKLTVGRMTSHKFSTFFYLKDQQELHLIPAFCSEDFLLHEYFEPVHAYYLEAK